MPDEIDLYAVLGVPPEASRAEIVRAYRGLVRALHPDLHAGDSGTAERFSAVTAAYEVLSDPRRRAAYDRTRPGRQGRGVAIPVRVVADPPASVFASDFLSGAAGPFDYATWPWATVHPRRSSPRNGRGRGCLEVPVALADAVYGGEVVVPFAGRGSHRLRLPAGLHDGERLRVRDARANADLELTIRVLPHPRYERRDDDLLTEVAVSFPEAALGAQVPVPALRGEAHLVTVPPGSRSGAVIRVRGAGVPTPAGAGDLLVRVVIDVPAVLSGEAQAALHALAACLPKPRPPEQGSS